MNTDASTSHAGRGRRTGVLLTGFGPFPGVPFNATMELVPRLAEAARAAFPDVRVAVEVLPTEWHAAPARLAARLATDRPDLTLHFGVSSRARGFEIEARGRNERADVADACGARPAQRMIVAGGPDHLAASIPVAMIIARLRRRGLPAFVSRDAGTYLCNSLLFHALDLARASDRPHRSGFIHVPAGLDTSRRPFAKAASPLTLEQAVEGGLEALAACLGRGPVQRARIRLLDPLRLTSWR